jgi:hypothetical protein
MVNPAAIFHAKIKQRAIGRTIIAARFWVGRFGPSATDKPVRAYPSGLTRG